jgi:4-amino-4-deoxy-L-arabinose transferase-like glycosyltransferase
MKRIETWADPLRNTQVLLAAKPLPIVRIPIGNFAPVALIVVGWILAALLVNPVGNFPLNDDWAYAASVRALVETGEYRLSHWTATNLLVQVLWGALFCLPFGFSFTALRISTLVLGLAGVLATYALLREARASKIIALLGACCLGFNPIYFALSFTFMSDVPFAAFAVVSSWLILRGIRRDSLATTLLGLVLALAALLIRQLGLALPIAFGVAWLLRHRRSLRAKHFGMAVLPCVFGLALQLGYQAWLESSGLLPAKFGNQISTLISQLILPWRTLLWDASDIIGISLAYLGLFISPFLVATYSIPRSPRERLEQIAVAAGGLIIAAFLTMRNKLMPLHGNVLSQGGISWDVAPAPAILWVGATFVAVLGGIILGIAVLRALVAFAGAIASGREPTDTVGLGFTLTVMAVAFAPLPLLGLGSFGFYDRYLIVFIPWVLLILVIAECSRLREISVAALRIGLLGLAGMATFSIMATHDYLDTNRSRWNALNDLMQRCRVQPGEIDGGFEFNGWMLSDSLRVREIDDILWSRTNVDHIVQLWSVREDYSELARFPVDWWLPWGVGEVFSQRRTVLGPSPCTSLERDSE